MKRRQFLIYILLAFVLLGTFYFSYFNYNSTKRFVLASVERETNELLNNFTAEVNRFSMERIAEIQLMADHLPYLLEKDEDIVQFLFQQNENMPFFTGLGFITPDGTVRAADGTTFPVKQTDSFERAIDGEIMFSDVFTLNQDHTQKVNAISVPIVDANGKIIGVLSGVVNLSSLISNLVEESNLPGTVFLLKDREVLFSSNDERPFDRAIPHSGKLLDSMEKEHTGNWSDSKDPLRFIAYQHAYNNWVVLVDSSTNPATDEITETFLFSIILDTGAVVIILFICLYLYRLQRQEQLEKQTDLLTDLGNRSSLEANLAKKLSRQSDRKIALFFIKLDRFAMLTEQVGYQMSDRILFDVSRRLSEQPSRLNVYRIGNEDFVLTAYLDSVAKQREYADMLVKALEHPAHTGQEGLIPITASVGVRALMPDDPTASIMQDGMYACLEAGKRGGNQFVYFTEQLAKDSEQHRLMVNHLATALENKELYLLYQPIYNMAQDRIASFETLMRWRSPVLGEVGPFHFIPLLEESDAIVEVGRWLIREVAEQVLRWEQEGYDNFAVTLNVSIRQLQHDGFLNDVRSILDETGVSPTRLVFEVTESIVAQNVQEAANILRTLNALGIKTAIDDFGTGYSSLSILKSLPFQYMKVDRAFILEVLSDEGESEAILRSLIEIADSLHLTTIMEGVETREQFNILKKLGAHRIQGYFFSKPVPPDEAAAFLEKEHLLDSMDESC